MAVTGHEVNVFRKLPNGTEQEVPCYESYNHHYVSFLRGKNSILTVYDDGSMPPEGVEYNTMHGIHYHSQSDGGNVNKDIPIIQAFSEHNGNEARQSYHGLPPNMVQPIESPNIFAFTPMQINTRNPDGSGRRCRGDCPLPKASRAPPNASYSGILECPCTDRVVKTYGGHFTQTTGVCSAPVKNANECFTAALPMIPHNSTYSTKNVTDISLPEGCFVQHNTDNVYAIIYNDVNASQATCDAPTNATAGHIVGSADVDTTAVSLGLDVNAAKGIVTITISVNDSTDATSWYGVGFNASTMGELPYTIVIDGTGAVSEHKLANHLAGTVLSPSVKVRCLRQTW